MTTSMLISEKSQIFMENFAADTFKGMDQYRMVYKIIDKSVIPAILLMI